MRASSHRWCAVLIGLLLSSRANATQEEWDCVGQPPNQQNYYSEDQILTDTDQTHATPDQAYQMARIKLLHRICDNVPCPSIELEITRFQGRENMRLNRVCSLAIVKTSSVTEWLKDKKPLDTLMQDVARQLLGSLRQNAGPQGLTLAIGQVEDSAPNAEQQKERLSSSLFQGWTSLSPAFQLVKPNPAEASSYPIPSGMDGVLTGSVTDLGGNMISVSWKVFRRGESGAVLVATQNVDVPRVWLIPPETPPFIRPVTIAGAGLTVVGVGGLAVATYLFLQGATQKTTADNMDNGTSKDAAESRATSTFLYGGLSAGLGAVAIAGGVVVLVLNREKNPQEIAVFPLTRGQSGIAVAGRF